MANSALLEEYLDRPTLARELRCSERTVIRYENEKDGLPSVLIGGRRYYRVESVRKWLASRERKPNPRRVA